MDDFIPLLKFFRIIQPEVGAHINYLDALFQSGADRFSTSPVRQCREDKINLAELRLNSEVGVCEMGKNFSKFLSHGTSSGD